MQRMPPGEEQSQPTSPQARHSLRARRPATSLASCFGNTHYGHLNRGPEPPKYAGKKLVIVLAAICPLLFDLPRFQQQDMYHTQCGARRLLKASVRGWRGQNRRGVRL